MLFLATLIEKIKPGNNMNPKFTANKKLGQHFLKDKKVISDILLTMPPATSLILEIGPGPGAITDHLIPLQKKVLLIEKDQRFVEHWQKQNLDCLCLDAMKVDWEQLLQNHREKNHEENEKIWIVSNLPYNISAPLTVDLMSIAHFTDMTLMYQKEVAEKMLGLDGMCSLYALAHAYFQVQKVTLVKPGAFHPPPKVDSLVLTFNRLLEPKVPIVEFRQYEKFLRNVFAYPRKQLNSVLAKFMPTNWQEKCRVQGIDLTLRAEKLSWEQLLTLYSLYC